MTTGCCSVTTSFLTLQPHGRQHTRLPCPSLSPRICSHSCPLSRWCHPTISSSAIPFSSCPQSFPASGSFPVRCFFTSSGQSIGASVSASVLPMNIQGWLPKRKKKLINRHIHNWVFPALAQLLYSFWNCFSQVAYWTLTDLGDSSSVSYFFAFSYCSWGSRSKNNHWSG